MRRVLVASVVLFIAACGGGVRPEATPEAAQRNRIPTDSESALLVESLVKTFGSDAVDSCLAAWQDAYDDGHANGAGPLSKPGAGFRAFLSRCVRGLVPAGLRDNAADSFRSETDRAISSDMRANRAVEMRNLFSE